MALVSGWFAKGWIVQPQEPNFHEDYVIERVEAGELSGAKIAVQLKGHATLKFKNGLTTEVMETKHLRYYAEKVRMPVFLFCVDTTKRRGYYLFLQGWIDANVQPTQLANQKKLSVRVPFANDIEDREGLVKAVESAFAYVAKKNAGTVEDAIASETRRLAAIDPRLDVKIDVVDGAKTITLHAKAPVSASLAVSDASREKLRALLEWGKAANLEEGEVSIQGLPIIDHFSKHKATLSAVSLKKHPNAVEMHLWSEGPDGFRIALPGAITGGTEGITFTAALPGTPIRAEMSFARDQMKVTGGAGNFSISFDFAQWRGKRIDALPYFEKVRGLATCIVEGRRIHHEFLEEGNRLSGGHFGNPKDMVPFAFAAAVVANIDKARQIAGRLGLEIRMPDIATISIDDLEAVDAVHALLFVGGLAFRNFEFSMNIELPATHAPEDAVRELENIALSGNPFLFQKSSHVMQVYGVPAELGPLVHSIRPVSVHVGEPGRSDFIAGRVATTSADIAGTPESTLTISRSSR